ncbi:MAG: sporulation protein YqfD [Clostridia bacterium]|nr:sporulation protein YqfD [Clostridia bacterium]
MLIIKLLRYLLGCVRFEASDGFIDRFVNLCWNRHIPLWNVTRTENTLQGDTSVKGYKRMRAVARKSAVRLHVTEKKGLPFVVRHNRMRAGMLAGGALALLFVLFAVSSVWQIRVNGNTSLSAYQIIASAEAAGLRRAVPKKRIDREAVSLRLIQDFPEISWCAVNIKGGTASIEILEVEKAPEVDTNTAPSNIIAAKDGYIEQLHVLRGDAAVKNGDAVEKGALLISGVIGKRDGTSYTVRAKGVCFAVTTGTLTAAAKAENYFFVQNIKQQKRLYVFGAEIPLGSSVEGQTVCESETDLGGGDFTLPLGVCTRTTYQTQAADGLDGERLSLLTAAEFYRQYVGIAENGELLSSEFSLRENAMTAKLRCREDIAAEQPMIIAEEES